MPVAEVGAPVLSMFVDAGKAVESLLVTEGLSVADAEGPVPVALPETLSVAVAKELSVKREPLERGAAVLLERSPD